MPTSKGYGPAYAGTYVAPTRVSSKGYGPAYDGTAATAPTTQRVSSTGYGPPYGGNVGTVTRVTSKGSGPAYAGSTPTNTRVSSIGYGPEYEGSVPTLVTTKTSVESGEFFTATADAAGAWAAAFPPEITGPAVAVKPTGDGSTAIVYAPASSKGYTFFLSCGPASTSVQVQPTSFDDRNGKPAVFYRRDELPLPFDPRTP